MKLPLMTLKIHFIKYFFLSDLLIDIQRNLFLFSQVWQSHVSNHQEHPSNTLATAYNTIATTNLLQPR